MASPDVVFDQTIDAALSRNSPRRQPETPATVDQWNLAKSLAFYKARFADASNFTFVFVGSFTPETPSSRSSRPTSPACRRRTRTRRGATSASRRPPGSSRRRSQKGIAPKSEVAIVFSGPFEYDDAHKLALRTMTLVLQSRLFDTIRQELGGTYSITATPDTEKFPRPEYSVRIDWTCDPARTASARAARVRGDRSSCKGTPLSRRTRWPSSATALLREFERNSQDNGYLLNQIARRYEDGDAANVAAVDNLPDQIAALTGDAIQQAAQTYLDTGNYVKVTLMPETK